MQKKLVWGIVAVLFASAALGGYLWISTAPVREVEKAVLAQLNDPESARFSDITFHPTTGLACGYVNAKNRMGGYGGRKHFTVIGDLVLFDQEEIELGSDASPEYRAETKRIHVEYLQSVQKSCLGDASAPPP